MKAFGWSEQFCRTGITSAKAQVFANWAVENEMSVFGAMWERKSDGYVKQEWRKRMKEMYDEKR